MWHSKTDISGSIFELASCYTLCFRNDMIQNKADTEVRLRFKCGSGDSDVGGYKPMPHYLTKQVWLRSMSVRYLLETLVFFALVAVYQYEVSLFNKDLHLSIDELAHYRALESEIGSRNGVNGISSSGNGAHDHRRALSDGAAEAFDYSVMSMEQLLEDKHHVHDVLLEEF